MIAQKQRSPLLSLTIAMVGFISACASTPSADEAQKLVEAQLTNRGWGSFARLSKFEKTNGVSKQASGADMYEMDYAAELTFTTTCFGEYDGRFSAINRGVPDLPRASTFNVFAKGPATQYSSGETLAFTGQLTFVKKENGWERARW
jgi:hypothetical protein